MSDALEMWTIYERPADYPGHFVARKSFVNEHGAFATSDALFAQTLESLRAKLPPHLFCIPRQPGDEPSIVEVWL